MGGRGEQVLSVVDNVTDIFLCGSVQVMTERSHGALNLIQLNVEIFTIHKQTYANNYTEM